MTFYIYVRSGLNNKLVPLLSLLRLAKKENRKIKCYWGEDAYIKKALFCFSNLFDDIGDIEFIDYTEYMTIFNSKNKIIYNKDGSDRNRKEIIYRPNENNDVIIFHKIVHLISYADDNVIGSYVPYPRETKETTPIIKEMRDIIKDLKPVNEIQSKINNVIREFEDNDVVGLHIRTTDGGFTDIPSKDVFDFIHNLLDTNKNARIYISCDTMSLENEIKNKFSDKILYFSKPFGDNYSDKFNRTSWGTMNAVCEMYILSKCSKFYGTPGSSLSFMVWLLRNDNCLDFWCENPWT